MEKAKGGRMSGSLEGAGATFAVDSVDRLDKPKTLRRRTTN